MQQVSIKITSVLEAWRITGLTTAGIYLGSLIHYEDIGRSPKSYSLHQVGKDAAFKC